MRTALRYLIRPPARDDQRRPVRLVDPFTCRAEAALQEMGVLRSRNLVGDLAELIELAFGHSESSCHDQNILVSAYFVRW